MRRALLCLSQVFSRGGSDLSAEEPLRFLRLGLGRGQPGLLRRGGGRLGAEGRQRQCPPGFPRDGCACASRDTPPTPMWRMCNVTQVCATSPQAPQPGCNLDGHGAGMQGVGGEGWVLGPGGAHGVWLSPCQPGGPWHGQAVPSTVLTVAPSLAGAVSSSGDCGGGSGCPEVSAAGAGPSASSGARSKEMQFGVETREHMAAPKPTPGARGARRKAKGNTCKGRAAPTQVPAPALRGWGLAQRVPHVPPPSSRISSPEWCRFRACLASCSVTAV